MSIERDKLREAIVAGLGKPEALRLFQALRQSDIFPFIRHESIATLTIKLKEYLGAEYLERVKR